ncbi:MAG: hypothetical protein PHO34_00335 [Candidatus Omnitrophica bacterium]|jgi:hypothetical protein|nr:hypothetical protein [Candidatus Omnitrophota bacterium]MDD5500682.1 hypothetical protein [Candidatus Omnitrophota bacterium]
MSEEKREKLSKFLKLFKLKKPSCCCVKIEEITDEKEKRVEGTIRNNVLK